MRKNTLKNSGRMVGILLAVTTVVLSAGSGQADDILIADFEQKTYGDWKVEGEAFGKGPAKGALGSQHHVGGFEGKGLVNTFLGGDRPTGTLTSPPLYHRTRLHHLPDRRQEAAGATLVAPRVENKKDRRYNRMDGYTGHDRHFMHPYPLNEREYIASYSAHQIRGETKNGYALYYVRDDAARELLAMDAEISCNQPVPPSAPLVRRSGLLHAELHECHADSVSQLRSVWPELRKKEGK